MNEYLLGLGPEDDYGHAESQLLPYMSPYLSDNMEGFGYVPPVPYCHPNQNNLGLFTGDPIPDLSGNVTGNTMENETTTIAESTSTVRPPTHICALCRNVYFTTRGALKRHINQQHECWEYSYQCPVYRYTEQAYIYCRYKHSRRYKTKKHIEDKHPDILISDPIRLNESRYPQTCSLCLPSPTFLSWKAWWQHFESHCRL
jgi:hypothetical protein